MRINDPSAGGGRSQGDPVGLAAPLMTPGRAERPAVRLSARRFRYHARVAVHRGHAIRNYRVSLRRYAALRVRTMSMGRPAQRSGGWMRNRFTVCFWPESGHGRELH